MERVKDVIFIAAVALAGLAFFIITPAILYSLWYNYTDARAQAETQRRIEQTEKEYARIDEMARRNSGRDLGVRPPQNDGTAVAGAVVP